MIEPFAEAMHHGCLKFVMVQNRGIHERRKLRLAPDNVFGFLTNTAPDRIERCHFSRLNMLNGHVPSCLFRRIAFPKANGPENEVVEVYTVSR